MNKEQAIAECGTHIALYTNQEGILVGRTLYCNYYNDCDRCNSHEHYRRQQAIREIVRNHQGSFFRAEIIEQDWDRVRKQLSKQEISYTRVPQVNGTILIHAGDIPKINNTFFIEVSHMETEMELCTHDNCFPISKRSSSRDWPLKLKKEKPAEIIGVVEIVPSFHPTKDSGPLTKKITNLLGLFASTWEEGRVTQNNAQRFVDHRMNKYIDIALELGFLWNKELTRVQVREIGLDEIAGWSVSSNKIENEKFGGNAEQTFSNRAYNLILGLEQPIDYVSVYKEHCDQERLKEELGDMYAVWYPVDQAELDEVVVY